MSGGKSTAWFTRARCAPARLILAAVVMMAWGATAPANVMLVSLDFNTTNSPTASGDVPGSPFTGQIGPWNVLQLGPSVDSNRNDVLAASGLTAGNGSATSVGFTFNTGGGPGGSTWRAYDAQTADPLRRDVMYLNSGSSPAIGWRISGLQPGTAYDLAFYGQLDPGGFSNPGIWSIDGLSLSNAGPPRTGQVVFNNVVSNTYGDGTYGEITGTFSRIGTSIAGWSGLQVAQLVPPPTINVDREDWTMTMSYVPQSHTVTGGRFTNANFTFDGVPDNNVPLSKWAGLSGGLGAVHYSDNTAAFGWEGTGTIGARTGQMKWRFEAFDGQGTFTAFAFDPAQSHHYNSVAAKWAVSVNEGLPIDIWANSTSGATTLGMLDLMDESKPYYIGTDAHTVELIATLQTVSNSQFWHGVHGRVMSYTQSSLTVMASAVPEPATGLMLLTALACGLLVRRR